MAWKLIGRNRKKVIAAVLAGVTEAESYHYDDMEGAQQGQHGPESAKWLGEEYWKFNFTKLYYDGRRPDGKFRYVMYVHQNCTYDFTSTYCPPGFDEVK